MGCGRFQKDKPGKVHLCDDPCVDCTSNCEPEHSDCPIHLTGQCVHYNGSKTFITQFSAGMTIDDCLKNVENAFEQTDRILDSYNERILELESILKDLLNNRTESCDTGYIDEEDQS